MDYKYFKEETEDGILYYLDIGTIPNEAYDQLKPIIEHLGGHWREKVKKFVFRNDVGEIIFDCIENGVDVTEKYKWQEETQFYPTPEKVAKRVVELAEIKEGMSLLEPSAGTGNLLDAVPVHCHILCVEPLMENSDVLRKKGYNHTVETFESFKEKTTQKFDRIIMNPPFAGQKDALHLMMAYELLKQNGVLTAIISENALYYQTEISDTLRSFLKEHNAHIENVPSNAFEESGTTIETVIVKIVK